MASSVGQGSDYGSVKRGRDERLTANLAGLRAWARSRLYSLVV
ncbi:hypothetical protein [Tepidiphilus sp. J10]|nr:hypothetical protein [Tepidiphilus sp. J10]